MCYPGGMNADIQAYNKALPDDRREICELLAHEIQASLPKSTSKIWHRSPVWFLDGNPVAGYSSLKDNVQLLFWSGQSFDERGLQNEGSFKAAQARYSNVDEIHVDDLKRWLKKAELIQWDYKNIVKKRGQLDRIR